MESPKKDEAGTEQVSQQPKRTLFVRSLPASATTESLADYFSQSYVIKHALVVNDSQTKLSKGYGFVTFADAEDAQSALQEFNGKTLDGKKIRVDYAQQRHREIDETRGKSVPTAAALEQKQQREQERTAAQPPKLIVRNLPWSIKTPDDLAAHFRSFGKVKFVTLPKRGDTLAGFGFVVLRGKKNAEKALAAVNGKEVDGRTLAVDWAVEKTVWEDLQKQEQGKEEGGAEEKSDAVEKPEAAVEGLEATSDDDDAGSDDEDEDEDEDEDMEDLDEDEEEDEGKKEDDRDDCTIFIRNLPFTATDDSLYEHFTQFGNLRYARIVVDHETERPRGTGFVCFWKLEDASSCVREAPKPQDTMAAEKDKANKANKASSAIKHSVLQNENADPSGRFTIDGRVLQVARAVSKTQADKLEEEGVSRRLVRDTDKRRLYLLNEGTIPTNSPLYKKLSPSEIKMREDSFKQRTSFIKKNPTLHLSLVRLAVRNIPRHVNSKDLKQLAREGVVGFAKDMKAGLREPLSKEELYRSSEEMKEAELERKEKARGIVRQAKIVFESREGSKIEEKSGAGRSRGYGFIEYYTHRHALMGLRWLNCHAIEALKTDTEDGQDRKKRLIVEFAIENAEVVKRRKELQERARNKDREQGDKNDKFKNSKDKFNHSKDKFNSSNDKSSQNGQKRKRPDGKGGDDEKDAEEENKVAKRNRIISRKRMQRKTRKGRA